jgi:hypothetical protein
MVVSLSALRTRRALLLRNIIILMFLVEAEQTPGPSEAGKIK